MDKIHLNMAGIKTQNFIIKLVLSLFIFSCAILSHTSLSEAAGIGAVAGNAPPKPVGVAGGKENVDGSDGIAGSGKFKCSGGFDVYFVLDRSASVHPQDFQHQTVDFVEALLKSFTSAKLRSSFITFSSEHLSKTILPLTRSRSEMADGISELRKLSTSGGTFLHSGIERANDQIRNTGGDTASVIITLTDGVLDDRSDAVRQANKARDLGAKVLAIRIGESSIVDIKKVADKPTSEHIFRGDTFHDLDTIIDSIVNTSCIEILSAEPTHVCAGAPFNVTINGNGFTKTHDVSKVTCNFRLNDTDSQGKLRHSGHQWYLILNATMGSTRLVRREGAGLCTLLAVAEVKPTFVSSTQIICQAPQIDTSGTYVVLQVSVNAISFISSNVTVVARSCARPNVAGPVLGVFLALILLGLLLLWWFWKLLCCVVVKRAPPPKPVKPPPPPPSPTKKWPAVDASYYGGGGPGGIKRMNVQWGDKGCTEAGSHLEKDKNAKLIKVNEEGGNGGNTPAMNAKPGCLDLIKLKLAACFAPVKSLYDRISIMRPQPGEKGYCCRMENSPARL